MSITPMSAPPGKPSPFASPGCAAENLMLTVSATRNGSTAISTDSDDGAVLVELACSLPSKRASGSAIVRHQPAKDRLNKSRLTVRKLTPMPNMETKSLHTIEKSAPRYAIPCMKLM